MKRIMLKSKIHRATITGTELDYGGSITVDSELLEKADILPDEQVHVLNLNNGNRFITYAIPGAKGSGIVILNGPAARLGEPGHIVMILSYCELRNDEAEGWKAKVIQVNAKNRVCRSN